MKTLNPAGMVPGVTRLDRGVFGAQPGAMRVGPVKSAPVQFTLIANAPAYVIAVANPARVGMLLQNRDVAADLFFNFGADANVSTGSIAPGQFLLLDFICPTDSVTVFATANVSGYFVDMSRTGM